MTEARGEMADEGADEGAAPAAPFEWRLPVAVQVERRAPVSRWASEAIVPVGVTPGALPLEEGALLVAGTRVSRHHAGNAELVVHRRDTEGVLANLRSPEPVLYVVMRPGEGALGARLHLVTASDHDAQDHTDAGVDEVTRVPMPEPVRAPIEAFVAAHHRDEPRRKRRRVVDEGEVHRFGREPVWTLPEGTLLDDRLDRPRERSFDGPREGNGREADGTPRGGSNAPRSGDGNER